MKKTNKEKRLFRGPLDGQIEAEGQLILLLRDYTPPNWKKKGKDRERAKKPDRERAKKPDNAGR